MSEIEKKLEELTTRLKHLENYEAAFKREIVDLRREINLLNTNSTLNKDEVEESSYTTPPKHKTIPKKEVVYKENTQQKEYEEPQKPFDVPRNKPKPTSIYDNAQSNLEKFIGENLISKIGIVVLIIGVGIGAKYAIDNNLISPLMRILFGYFVGLGLIGFAVKLKSKYHDFSAVLLSGGMAIMYFITYFAYSYYSLLSQISAFSLMVIFTVFTVFMSIIYKRQIIAHIGLVGAYAIPFLLSENSGNYAVLFAYMAIINIGILAVSVKQYWKPLIFNSFIFTWLIYIGWYFGKYEVGTHFNLAFAFLAVFFTIFYFTILAYKLLNKEQFQSENLVLIFINSFIFYGFGYSILSNNDWSNYLGLFTIFNALIHFVVAAIVNQINLKDKIAFYFIVALVLSFISITIHVQFEGYWVTNLLIAEAVFLFIIGRTKKIALFEWFSYFILLRGLTSLLHQWQIASENYPTELENTLYPILNSNFLNTLIATVGIGVIWFVDRNKNYVSALEKPYHKMFSYMMLTYLLGALFNLFRIEISNYFYYQEIKTAIPDANDFSITTKNDSLQLFNFVWQLNYSMLFLTILSFVNIKKLKSSVLGFANLVLNSASLVVFLIIGLIIFRYLGDLYLNPTASASFQAGIYNVLIRYISLIFVAGLIFASYKYIKQEFLTKHINAKQLLIGFDIVFYFVILVILSSELINWSEIIGIEEIYRLGLSILFGIYAVLLIVLGIIQKKQHLRIFAIVLFAVTLIKLFLYDTAELETISKTVVFISIGILLLIASFLYTKYKNLMFKDEII